MIKTDWISVRPYIVGDNFFYTLNNSITRYTKKDRNKINKQINISTNIVLDSTMKKLNNSWRGINKTTDVLSFPYNEDRSLTSHEQQYDGEVIISVNQAMHQAKEHKHSLRAEIAILYIHGVLHVLGYDHGLVRESKKMYSLQNKIFINWKTVYGQKNVK